MPYSLVLVYWIRFAAYCVLVYHLSGTNALFESELLSGLAFTVSNTTDA